MTLRCAECNRPLLRFTASVKVRGSLIGWGPKCAVVAGQVQKHSRPPVRRDQRTVDWVLEATT